MKIEKELPIFKPITIILENQDEVDMFDMLLNVGPFSHIQNHDKNNLLGKGVRDRMRNVWAQR